MEPLVAQAMERQGRQVRRIDEIRERLDKARPGLGMPTRLAQVIAAAAIQREIDQLPCPTCGGDPLRPAFDGRTDCHVPWPKEDQTDE